MKSENTTGAKPRKPIHILRERHGGASDALKRYNRAQIKTIKNISEYIRDGYKTVPEIAGATGIPSHEAFWHLMALKKYGKVKEGEERNGYYEYTLKEEEKTE